MINLEEDIEPFLDKEVCLRYWHSPTDHEDFRAIVDAIDTGSGQPIDICGVLKELYKRGFIIKKL